MIPNVLKIDPDFVNEDGTPGKGAVIYETHIKCHPDESRKVIDGIKQMMDIDLTIIIPKGFEWDGESMTEEEWNALTLENR